MQKEGRGEKPREAKEKETRTIRAEGMEKRRIEECMVKEGFIHLFKA